MTSVQTRSDNTSVSPPAAATRPLLDLVSRFMNRIEDGDRPGHKLISARLAPQGADRDVLEDRRAHLLGSLAPPDSEQDRKAMGKIVAALLGAFPTYGADREDAKATVALICRALDDVPVWAVQRAAGNFLKGAAVTRWNPDRAPTPPQIRAEAKLITLEVETELYRLGQVLDAELVDNHTTDDERKENLAKLQALLGEISGANSPDETADERATRDAAEQIRANEGVRRREAEALARAQAAAVPSSQDAA